MKIIELDSVDSTNEYIKNNNFNSEVAVIAKRQSAGRGTKGRSFSSAEGGLYISTLKIYKNFPASKAFSIMVNCACAVCATLEYFGLKPTVKWANDILVNGKKICGTLIENTFSGGNIARSIVGIGLNVNNPLPQELENIATSMQKAAGRKFDLTEVKNRLLAELEKNYGIEKYRSYMEFNKKVKVLTADGEFEAVILGVSDDGRLKVERGGEICFLSSAEVSLRGIDKL